MSFSLSTLIFERSTQLQEKARRVNLKGYSKLDRGGLIAELSQETLSKTSREILSENKPALKTRAREAGLKGFSKMKRDRLALELIRAQKEDGSAAADEAGRKVYVKVYVGETHVGYCPPEKRPGVRTYLRRHGNLEEALREAREQQIGFKIDALESILPELPSGAVAKEPPR